MVLCESEEYLYYIVEKQFIVAHQCYSPLAKEASKRRIKLSASPFSILGTKLSLEIGIIGVLVNIRIILSAYFLKILYYIRIFF